MALTDTAVRNSKPREKPYKLGDRDGLYLLVQPGGAKLWRFKYRLDARPDGRKKEHLYAIGQYPEVSLAAAREETKQARELVGKGKHPVRHRRAEHARRAAEASNTFEAVAREWMGKHRAKWTPYYARQVERFMERDVFPKIGALPMREISAAQLLAIVKAVEKRGAETVALLIRQWCSAIFRYAVATLRADTDPAAALKGALHRPTVQHRRPLDRKELPKLMEKIEGGGYRSTQIALRLLLLLFVRPVELRAAAWEEFDLDAAEWRIPAHRMKMRREHIVPLPRQAVWLLRELHKLTGGQKWLFPNQRRPKTHMSATTLNRALERLGFNGKESIGFSAHGFRATASTLLNEMGYNPDWIERQLAHAPRNKVRASYNQAQYLAERRRMVQEWADFIDGLGSGGKVTTLHRKRAL